MKFPIITELQKSLYKQQEQLFERYSKILMIRTDFHWHEHTDRYHYGDEHQFSYEMSTIMLQLSEYEGVVGYAWVLEEGHDRGLHAHAIIYINGQQHCKKWGFESLLNSLWREITESEGLSPSLS